MSLANVCHHQQHPPLTQPTLGTRESMLISPISQYEDDNDALDGVIRALSRPSHVVRKWWRPHRGWQSWHWVIKRRCHLMSQQHKVTESLSSQLSTICRCYYYFISLQGPGYHVTTSLTWLMTSPENNCIINNHWVRYRPTNASRVSRRENKIRGIQSKSVSHSRLFKCLIQMSF